MPLSSTNPLRVRVRVEVPRLSFVKRGDRGIEYLSPVPSPFNYGCVPDRPAPDGDALDAVVLGPRLAVGAVVDVPVHAVVRFIDDGALDDKLVCGPVPTPADLRRVAAFFRVYAFARRWMNRVRGRTGDTRYDGLERV